MLAGVIRIMVGSAIAAGILEVCVHTNLLTVSEAFMLTVPVGVILGLFELGNINDKLD